MTSHSQKTASEETLMQHIAALRSCLVRYFAVTGLLFCVTAFFSREIFALLASPLQSILPQGSHFITVHPVEAWYTYLKTALFAAAFLSTPVAFREFWNFVSPGLLKGERKNLFLFVTATSVLFIGGACFGYFVAFPSGFHYFADILNGTDILFLPRMEDYLGFATHMLLAFGIVFETPLFMLFLVISGAVSFQTLWQFQRYYVLVAFIIAAILTPPDALSQTMMGLPMIALYELGLLGAWIWERSHTPKPVTD